MWGWKKKGIDRHTVHIHFKSERVFWKPLLNHFGFTLSSLIYFHNKNQEVPNEHVYFKNNNFISLSTYHQNVKETFICRLKFLKHI